MEPLLTNYQFAVTVGANTYGFSKLSNLAQELEYDSIQEGGSNTPLFFRKPKSKFDTLTLEKGIQVKGPFFTERSLQLGQRVEELIIFMGDGEKGYIKYTFDVGVVTKFELDQLDAMGNAVLIGKVEIIHSGLKKM